MRVSKASSSKVCAPLLSTWRRNRMYIDKTFRLLGVTEVVCFFFFFNVTILIVKKIVHICNLVFSYNSLKMCLMLSIIVLLLDSQICFGFFFNMPLPPTSSDNNVYIVRNMLTYISTAL